MSSLVIWVAESVKFVRIVSCISNVMGNHGGVMNGDESQASLSLLFLSSF